MKKYLSFILTAALLIAALAVPAAATTGRPAELYDMYLYIHLNGDAASPTKIVNISNHSVVSDDVLTLADAISIVGEHFSAGDLLYNGMYLDGGIAVREVADLSARRTQEILTVHIYASTETIAPSAGAYVAEVSGDPGELVTLRLQMFDLTATSVGIKYTVPEGLEFVSGQWLLEDGFLTNVTDFGAAFAWTEARNINADALELTFRIRENAPMQMRVPFEVVVKNVDYLAYSATCYGTVNVNYIINGLWLDSDNCNISVGTTASVGLRVDPEMLAGQVNWYSSDESVATVEKGIVTGVSAGTATITAQLGEYTSQCSVNVFEAGEDTGTKPCLITGEPGCVKHIRCILNSMFG